MIEKNNPFKLHFDSYILQSEPEQQENGKLWQTAIGLQQVDGLTPSKYLYEWTKESLLPYKIQWKSSDKHSKK